MGTEKAFRAKLLRALHAEGKKRCLDHDDLRNALGVKSLGDASTDKIAGLLRNWTKRVFRRGDLPRRGYGQQENAPLELIALEDLDLLSRTFVECGMDGVAAAAFMRRQLRGRENIRTRADFHKVFSGLRAMQRRREAKAS